MSVTNPNEIATYPSTAHLPGAFPDLTCRTCVNYDACSDKRKGRCLKALEMRGMLYRVDKTDENWWRGLPSIPGATLACKYYVAAPVPEKKLRAKPAIIQ